mgnify:CR=1 FL=1
MRIYTTQQAIDYGDTMNSSQRLLTELKAAHGLPSDYKAAKFLEVTHQSISGINTGRSQFSDENLVKIAHLLNLDPVETLAKVHIETAKSHKMRQVWEGILENAHLATIRASRGIQADQVA